MQRYSWLEKLSKGSSLQKFSGINYARSLFYKTCLLKELEKPYGIKYIEDIFYERAGHRLLQKRIEIKTEYLT